MVWVDPRVGLGWVGSGWVEIFLKDFHWVGLKKLDPRQIYTVGPLHEYAGLNLSQTGKPKIA